MCQNLRLIRNRYTGQTHYVKCGHCQACQQEKADKRASRIRSHRVSGQQCLFVHLTYLNECVPYVYRSDFNHDIKRLPVYRDYDRRWSRLSGNKRNYALHFHKQCGPVDYIDIVDDHGVSQFDNIENLHENLLDLQETFHPRWTTKSMKDKIGICYYPDLQNFIKKLRINLFRSLHYDLEFSYYATSEYGEDGNRPHFHLLIFFPEAFEALMRSAILKSWTFAFQWITERRLEPAIDAATYASSYVNKPETFPKVFETSALRPRWSYSQGFGMGLRAFQLDSILEQVKRGDLRYSRSVSINGVPSLVDCIIPKYVICRYFPQYKGFSRFTGDTLRWLGQCPSWYGRSFFGFGEERRWEKDVISPRTLYYDLLSNRLRLLARSHLPGADYTSEDIHKIVTSVLNKCDLLGMHPKDYFDNYVNTWNCYHSTLLKIMHDDDNPLNMWYKFDNIEDYYSGAVRSDFLDDLIKITPSDFRYEINPNDFPENVANSERLVNKFNSYIKKRSCNAAVFEKIY